MAAVAAAVVLGVAIAWYLTRPPVAVVGEVVREDVVRVLAVTGEITARWRVEVLPLVTGELVALNAREGERVAAGAEIGRVAAAEARARLEGSIAAVGEEREQLEQARRELGRSERLFSAGAIAARDLEEAGLAVAQSEERVRQFEATVAEARAQLGEHVLRAPMDAVVLSRPVDPGQVVGPETVVYELAAVEGRYVEAAVDERYLDELAPGMPAAISPIGLDTVYEGSISFISREVDPETGAATVWFRFSGAPPRLPFGRSVDINILVARHEDALTVPRAAVAGIDALPWVLVVRDGRTERRSVRVIDWPSPRIVVRSGLEAGDVVIVNPLQVPVGEAVRPERGDDAV